MTAGLTPVLANALDAIRGHSADGVSPSVRELMEITGTRSSGRMQAILYSLRDRGAVTWAPGCARSIRIIERPTRADLARMSDEDLLAVMTDIEDIVARRDDAAEARP